MRLTWNKLTRIKVMKLVIVCAITIFLVLTVVLMLLAPVQKQPLTGFPQQYVHPHNISIKGIMFRMNSYDYNLAMHLMTQLEIGKKVKALTMDSLVEAMTPVTAVSSNHFHELLKNLDNFHQFVPNKRLIVYDLGLTQDEVYTLKRIDYVEYRNFDLSIYPEHVRNLHLYAWKPLIIHEVLVEQGGVMWMDSSVKIRKPYTKALEQMVNNSSGFLYYLLAVGDTIKSSSHPKMFEYFPMKNLHEKKSKLPQAGGILVFNTREIRLYVLKWAILCVLLRECIAPKGSTMYCDPKYPEDKTGGCHRYDQSMFSILVTNLFSTETRRYTIAKKSKFARVSRLDFPFYRQVLIFLKSWFQRSWIYKTFLS